LNVFVVAFPSINDLNHNSLNVLKTNQSFDVYKKMCQEYIKLNGFLMPYDDNYIESYGAFKPSTGILAILHSIQHYNYVKIVNFDSFRSNHYWKEQSRSETNRYKIANSVIGHHQPLIERSIINTLFKNKYIDII
jgi:hypothetical protein